MKNAKKLNFIILYLKPRYIIHHIPKLKFNFFCTIFTKTCTQFNILLNWE